MDVSVKGKAQRVTTEGAESVSVDCGRGISIVVEGDSALQEIRVLIVRPDADTECVWSVLDEELATADLDSRADA